MLASRPIRRLGEGGRKKGMKNIERLIPWALGVACLIWASLASASAPTVGEPAPAFRFEGQGGPFVLSDYVGPKARKGGVVIAWFPKAFTPG
jgi:peroxiredoxin Q/BCP